MTYLHRIILYPIKSLDGINVTQATVLQSGALQHDRQYAILDKDGNFVNGKRHPKIHLLRSSFDIENKTIYLQLPDDQKNHVFHIDKEEHKLAAFLTNFFNFPVHLQQNSVMGFPDDTHSPGPTVISNQTIESVAAWFPQINTEEMRSRLRVNLEFGDVPAFWEDQLFAKKGEIVNFKVGNVLFKGINPCQRCIVPTRDTRTAKVDHEFQKVFSQKRKETLPIWAEVSHFNHFYRLSVNTQIPETEAGKVLKVGDEVLIANY